MKVRDSSYEMVTKMVTTKMVTTPIVTTTMSFNGAGEEGAKEPIPDKNVDLHPEGESGN